MKIMAALMMAAMLGCWNSFSEGDPCGGEHPTCIRDSTLGTCRGGVWAATACGEDESCCLGSSGDYCAASCLR